MSYYIARKLTGDFQSAVARTIEALKTQGFGVVTEIDMAATLKQKIGADFRPYKILGACNPTLALEALRIEDKVGAMLPCNVVVQEFAKGDIEVAAVDPVASMTAIDNPALGQKAQAVKKKLEAAINLL